MSVKSCNRIKICGTEMSVRLLAPVAILSSQRSAPGASRVKGGKTVFRRGGTGLNARVRRKNRLTEGRPRAERARKAEKPSFSGAEPGERRVKGGKTVLQRVGLGRNARVRRKNRLTEGRPRAKRARKAETVFQRVGTWRDECESRKNRLAKGLSGRIV